MGNKPMTLMQLKQILRSLMYGIEEGSGGSVEAVAIRYAATVGLSAEQVRQVLDTPLRELLASASQK